MNINDIQAFLKHANRDASGVVSRVIFEPNRITIQARRSFETDVVSCAITWEEFHNSNTRNILIDRWNQLVERLA